jgi:hypothetical protein
MKRANEQALGCEAPNKLSKSLKKGFARSVMAILIATLSSACGRAEYRELKGGLGAYLNLPEDVVMWLREPEGTSVFDSAVHQRIGEFDVFTQVDTFSAPRRLYVASNGKLLAVLDPEPGSAEIYDGRSPPFELMARVSAKFPDYLIYRGDGLSIEDHAWDGPDLIYSNQSMEFGLRSYQPGGKVHYPKISSRCQQADPDLESVACCSDPDGKKEAWVFNALGGWRILPEDSKVGILCRTSG